MNTNIRAATQRNHYVGWESASLGADRDGGAEVRALSAKKTEAPRKSGGSPTALEECACGVRLQGASASSVTRRSSGMSFAVGILYVPALHHPVQLPACKQLSALLASQVQAALRKFFSSRAAWVLAKLGCAHLGRGCAGRLGGATCGPHPPRPAPPGRSSPCPAQSRPPPACSPATRILTHGPRTEISQSNGHAWWGLHLPGAYATQLMMPLRTFAALG